MPVTVKLDLLPTQKKFFYNDIDKTILYSGGLGSGKSFILVQKFLKLSQINKHISGGFLSPSYADFKKDIYPLIIETLENNKIKYKYHKTDKVFWFPWSKAPHYIFTAEKPIAGPNLGFCCINEYSLMPFDRVGEMLRRVRVKSARSPQKCLAGTPEDIHGWLEDFVEAQEKRGSFSIYFADTKENIHLSDDYREYLKSILDDTAFKVFAGGQIVRIGGTYFYYSFSRDKNIDASIEYNKDAIIHVGLDFNVGNMSASFSHKVRYRDHYEQHIFDELVLIGDSNTYDIAKAILKRYPKDNILITCDASGKNRSTAANRNVRSDVGILRSLDLTVRYRPANIRLRKRQLLVNGILDKGHIKINPRCKGLIKDLEKVQQSKVDFTKIKDKDHKLTHLSDGLDYVLDFEYKLDFEKERRTETIQL